MNHVPSLARRPHSPSFTAIDFETANRFPNSACADIALYKAQALTEPADFPRHVLAERGEGARRSLRAAPELAIPGRDLRLVLEAWAEGLT